LSKEKMMSIEAMKQEPVAFVTGYYGGRCVIEPLNKARVFPSGMGLYAAPPAAQEPWLTKELMAEYIEAISTAIYRNQTGELTYIADKLRRGES
jgi:NAD(P)H-dependent FMN reductase